MLNAVFTFLAGLVDGYNAGCGATNGEMKPIEFKFMNMNGDLFDIKAKFPSKKEEAVCCIYNSLFALSWLVAGSAAMSKMGWFPSFAYIEHEAVAHASLQIE